MLPSRPIRRRRLLAWSAALAAAVCAAPPAAAQGVDLVSLELQRREGVLTLDFAARLQPSRALQEALQRGVPVYFVAEAQVLRSRWYWRDERVARSTRTWRLAFQPLTGTWRVGLGGFTQPYASLSEALAAVTRLSGWRLAELAQLDPDGRHYVEFTFRLDTTQLPGPMQIGLTGQADWVVRVDRTLRVD